MMADGPGPFDSDFFTIRDIVRFLRRRWAWILFPGPVVGGIAWLILFLSHQPQYVSSMAIDIGADPHPDLQRNLTPNYFLRLAQDPALLEEFRKEAGKAGGFPGMAEGSPSAALIAGTPPVFVAGLVLSLKAGSAESARAGCGLLAKVFLARAAKSVEKANEAAGVEVEARLALLEELLGQMEKNTATLTAAYNQQRIKLGAEVSSPEGLASPGPERSPSARDPLIEDPDTLNLRALQQSYLSLQAKRVDLAMDLPLYSRKLGALSGELKSMPDPAAKEGGSSGPAQARYAGLKAEIRELDLQVEAKREQIRLLDEQSQKCMADLAAAFSAKTAGDAQRQVELAALDQRYLASLGVANQALKFIQGSVDALSQARINLKLAKLAGIFRLLVEGEPANLPAAPEPDQIARRSLVSALVALAVGFGLALILAALETSNEPQMVQPLVDRNVHAHLDPPGRSG